MTAKAAAPLNFPIHLQVDNIQSCSGIFISGQNVIYGWSAHSKANTGFGSLGSSNVVQRNLTVLQDPDQIDTPIDDRDVHVFTQANARPQVTNIGFQSMNVSTMQQNAGVFVGEGNITGWDQHQKTNKGLGDVYGHHNGEFANVSINFDHDLIDAPINDQDVKSGLFHRIG